MRIALLAYLHGNGGAERQITMLANALSSFGHDVFFVITGANNIRYPISETVKCVDVTQCEGRPFGIFRRYFAQRKALYSIKPDITIHYNFQSAYFAVTLSKKKIGKIVYSERGDPADKEYSGLLGVIRNVSIKHIDGFVFQSEGARDYFDMAIQQRSAVIHNAVSVKVHRDSEKEREKRIVALGRLSPEKNFEMLLTAFATVALKAPEYKLEIYGEGRLEDSLKELAKRLGILEKVEFKQPIKEIHASIINASVFVMTSFFEGMPNALLEALALGMPCVSTDCPPGGVRSIVEDGVNGLLVPVDDAEALAERLLLLIKNKDLAKRLGEEASTIKLTHSPEAIYKKWNDFIISINK